MSKHRWNRSYHERIPTLSETRLECRCGWVVFYEIEIEERDGKQVLKPVRAHTTEPLETTVFRDRLDPCQG